MKKFTLLLASAAVASTAMAAMPQQVVKFDQPVAAQKHQMEQATVCNDIVESAPIVAKSRAVELTEDYEELDVRYRRPTAALYNGLTQELAYYSQLCGVVGVYGGLQFANYSSGADSYTWSWNNYLKDPYTENYTSSATNLELNNKSWPMSFVSVPELSGSNSFGEESAYALDSVACYRFGGNLAGMLQDYAAVGLSRCSTVGSGGLIYYMAYDVTGDDADAFTKDGVYTQWASTLDQVNGAADGSCSDVKIKGFGTTLPRPTSPYLMSQMWIWVNGTVSEDTELTATIYEIDEEGYVTDKVVGKGTCVVNKGDLGVLTYDILPVDEDGFETYEAFTSSTGLYISLNIEDNDAITSFMPVFNKGNVLPMSAQRNEYYPATAYINLSYMMDGVEQEVNMPCPYNYYTTDKTAIWSPSDMFVMYDISFPYVTRADDTFGDFNVLIPSAEAATGTLDFTGFYYNFAEMINNGSMTAETEDDWFEFTIGDANTETYLTTITVEAEALPAGVTGRTGKIEFTGMAQNFTVNVYQGEAASGLGSIVVANEGAEYFDIQGRKLQSAPATGLYIERNGDKVTKVIR